MLISYFLTERKGVTLLEVTQDNIPDQTMCTHAEANWNKVLQSLKVVVEQG